MLNSFQTMEFVRGLLYIFDLPDDAFSGPIIQSWVKLGKYVEAFRARVQRDTGFEWFQWLAERMLEREGQGSAIPPTSPTATGRQSKECQNRVVLNSIKGL